jgi:hypothetical protein
MIVGMFHFYFQAYATSSFCWLWLERDRLLCRPLRVGYHCSHMFHSMHIKACVQLGEIPGNGPSESLVKHGF